MPEPREIQAHLVAFDEVHDLPGSWPASRLRRLVELLELEGVGDDELRDMATMGLQDHDPEDAAALVLQAVFGDGMRTGVREELAHDLGGDRPWEEFATLSQQRGIFEACVLLQEALPRSFGKPDAVRCELALTATGNTARGWLEAEPVDPALLLRVLAAGMGEQAVLRRLFEDALAGPAFPEAPAIVWHSERVADGTLAVWSSHQWLDPLEDAGEWSAKVWPDL